MTKATKTEAKPSPIPAVGLFGRSSTAPATLREHSGTNRDPRDVVKAA